MSGGANVLEPGGGGGDRGKVGQYLSVHPVGVNIVVIIVIIMIMIVRERKHIVLSCAIFIALRNIYHRNRLAAIFLAHAGAPPASLPSLLTPTCS